MYHGAMPEITVGTMIDASVTKVWNAVKDIEDHVNWMDDAVAINFIGSKRKGIGTLFDCETRIGPFKLLDRMEITEWVESKTMGVSHTGLVSGVGKFTLCEQSNGQTKFQWEESLSFPFWMGGPLRNVVGRKILKMVWVQNLENLKDRVEGNNSGKKRNIAKWKEKDHRKQG
jgi:uncharacterized protein YndB with AHSA1/START domain